MAEFSNSDVRFTKHLFRTGLECPTRLFYKAKGYPENRESDPFIAHYHYNKRQLKRLARSAYPEGVQISASSMERACDETQRLLQKNRVILFDPVFLYERFIAKVHILEKKGEEVNLYQIQTRAFHPGKHNMSSQDGKIYPKWLDYLTDFAFQVRIISKCHPGWKVNPSLVLPAKYARAKTDRLHDLLRQVESGEIHPRNTELNDEELLAEVDVSEEIERILSGKSFIKEDFKGKSFEAVLQTLAGYFYSNEKYPVTVGGKCKDCEFRIEEEREAEGEQSGFEECWNTALDKDPREHKPLVFNLIGPGTNQWIERGIYFQEDVPAGELYDINSIRRAKGRINEKQRQSLQIMLAKGKPVPEEIVKPNLFKELQRWEYPIHFLDFEAGNYAVPVRKNRKPYHLVVFQYSCHTLHQNGTLEHHEWIDELNGEYPNYEMVRRLKDIPHITEGTIVQYSNFERHALKIIRKELMQEEGQIPDGGELLAWLYEMIRRHDSSHHSGPYLADLSRLVKNFYYNRKMEDSLSIKDVLQSMMSVSPRLKQIYSRPYSSSNFDSAIWWQKGTDGDARSPYRLMFEEQEKGIRRGTEAMVVYAKLLSENLSRAEQQACKKALLRYCEVDTLAMIMIYQHWRYLMEQNWN